MLQLFDQVPDAEMRAEFLSWAMTKLAMVGGDMAGARIEIEGGPGQFRP